jgi:hypothetical protein
MEDMLGQADGLRLTITGCLLLAGPAHAGSVPVQRATTGFVTLWSDREEPYRRGDEARIYLRTDRAAHLTVVRVDTDGRLRMLFPRDPGGRTRVAGARTFEVTRPPNGRSFRVDDYPGIGYLLAIVSSSLFNYDDITRGDHWDYRAIGYGRLQGDPYVGLAGFAASISRGRYQYDIAPYYVERRYEYPRFVCYDCHSYARYDEWDPYAAECSRFRVVIYDDPSYYPFRYNQGRNVAVSRPTNPAPRYVFKEARPGLDYVTRLRGSAERRHLERDRGRSSADVGGRGAVPIPELWRRRADPEPRRTPAAQPGQRNPRSIGEPELRRRKPESK